MTLPHDPPVTPLCVREAVTGGAYHRVVAEIPVTWVPYGREAADALRRAVAAAKDGEPLAPVTVVVPSNHVGVASRRLLASGRLGPICARGTGLAAVTFLTPFRLAELLGAARLAATGRRPVSTPVIAAAVRGVLTGAAGLFEPVAAHPATESALVAAYRELRDLSPDALDRLAGRSERAAEVVRVHRATRDRLAEDWSDEQDLMLAAAEVLRDAVIGEGVPGRGAAGRGAVGDDVGTVIVHLPQRISRHAGIMLASVAAWTPLGVLAGLTGDERADADVRTAVGNIVGPEAAVPENPETIGPETPSPARAANIATTTRFITTSDADDEVRAAVRAVVDAVRAGTPLDRIALLYASPEPYARLAHEQLRAADVPTNGASVVPLTARVAGRSLVRLLGLPEADFRRQDVFTWLAAAPVRHGGRRVPVSAWERLSRRAGVVAGVAQWDERLERMADDLEASARRVEDDPDLPPWHADRDRAEAASALRLRDFVVDLAGDLERAASRPRSWGDHARWAQGLLDRTLGPADRRADWPTEERRAGDRVERAIDRLAALDAVEGEVPLEVFARTLTLELEDDIGRIGRFGLGVLVGGVGMGVGLDLDLVVVLGLAEGTFPATVHDDSLLPDDERRAAGDHLPLRRDGVERQHRQLLAALAGASDRVLCVPRGDLRRSRTRVASRWALDLASIRAGERWWSDDLLAAQEPWIEHVPSFDAGMRRAPSPATAQEHRLRSLSARGGGRHTAGSLRTSDDPVLASGAAVVEGRRGRAFSRFDGRVAGVTLPSPVDHPISATALERWAGCPFAYFLRDVLRVDDIDNPEDELQITPLDKGKLVHRALETFVLEVLARPAGSPPGPDDPWTADDHNRLTAIAEELFARYEARGLTGRPIFWRRDRAEILGDLRGLLRADDRHRREHRTRPIAAELSFGLPHSELDPVPLTLPDGRSVRFRGLADRVDLGEDGTIHVIDYKTGRYKTFRKLSEEEPDQRGTKLQLAVYGTAARAHQGRPDAPVSAEYLFISARRGRYRRFGYAVTSGVLDRVAGSVATIVAGIETGTFPSHPTDGSTAIFVACPACDPDGLGVADLHRAWPRKRQDPAMALYADLADPLVEVEVEVETGATDG